MAVGMVLELLVLRLLGLISPVVALRLQLLLRRFSLPVAASLTIEEGQRAFDLITAYDKKRRGGRVFITHVEDIGRTNERHVVGAPCDLLRLVLSPVVAVKGLVSPCGDIRTPSKALRLSSPLDAVVLLPGEVLCL